MSQISNNSNLSGSMRNSNLRKSLKRKSKRMKLKPLTVEKKETDDVMNDWKFTDEKTRKIVEYRLLKAKRRKMKRDKKKLTATERYQKFLHNKKGKKKF